MATRVGRSEEMTASIKTCEGLRGQLREKHVVCVLHLGVIERLVALFHLPYTPARVKVET